MSPELNEPLSTTRRAIRLTRDLIEEIEYLRMKKLLSKVMTNSIIQALFRLSTKLFRIQSELEKKKPTNR